MCNSREMITTTTARTLSPTTMNKKRLSINIPGEEEDMPVEDTPVQRRWRESTPHPKAADATILTPGDGWDPAAPMSTPFGGEGGSRDVFSELLDVAVALGGTGEGTSSSPLVSLMERFVMASKSAVQKIKRRSSGGGQGLMRPGVKL